MVVRSQDEEIGRVLGHNLEAIVTLDMQARLTTMGACALEAKH